MSRTSTGIVLVRWRCVDFVSSLRLCVGVSRMLGDMERDVDDVQGRMNNVLKTIGKFLQTKSERKFKFFCCCQVGMPSMPSACASHRPVSDVDHHLLDSRLDRRRYCCGHLVSSFAAFRCVHVACGVVLMQTQSHSWLPRRKLLLCGFTPSSTHFFWANITRTAPLLRSCLRRLCQHQIHSIRIGSTVVVVCIAFHRKLQQSESTNRFDLCGSTAAW
jgi:hypothetical protein